VFNLFYYPMYLFRRLLFVLIPTVLISHPAIQLQCLTFLNLFHMMFYAGNWPHASKQKCIMEMINEYCVMILTYHMFTFTAFVGDIEAQFLMGYSFVLVLCFILGVNVLFMAKNSIKVSMV